MQDLFITKIHINKVRHLENIDICLSENEKKHLIITGKNGSGKTSLLTNLENVFGNLLWKLDDDGQYTSNNEDSMSKTGIKVFGSVPNYDIEMMYSNNLFRTLPANRKLKLEIPKAIEAIDADNGILYSDIFLKYLLYLNYQKMNAITTNNESEANKVQKWFDTFLNTLREIYDCPTLELKHNSKDLSFKIVMDGREPFGLNEMADGYSSLLYIITELMMRMENKASIAYDLPGIVLIDEIETHLHVELQKRVLPFLIKMFPRIQFIVTTHSPFVITSISNAVVYDLEKQEALENLSAYSYEGIIEYYFDTDMYSQKATKMFEQYKSLIDKQERTPEECRLLTDAVDYLGQIPLHSAKELVYAFREMEKQRGVSISGQAW